ncbi:MAG: hypothetical protein PVH88_21250 [Ignavibacteria bacterium]|jgi:hypothetical protein
MIKPTSHSLNLNEILEIQQEELLQHLPNWSVSLLESTLQSLASSEKEVVVVTPLENKYGKKRRRISLVLSPKVPVNGLSSDEKGLVAVLKRNFPQLR